MKRLMGLAAMGLAVLMFGTGCSHKTTAERDSLMQQNKSLQDEITALKARADAADARANAAANTAAAPAPEAAPATDEGLAPSMTTGGSSGPLPSGLTRGHNAVGEDTISVSSDVLFDSGKASLKPAAKRALDKAASILKREYSGRQIRVEGYTDPTPVRKAGWDDNWDLGASRARAVMLYLQSKGIRNMYIASFGATNLKSTKKLALDRRVEIVVVRGSK